MNSLTCGISLKKKGYKWTYLQNFNRLIDIENKIKVPKGKCGEEG